MRVAGGHRNGFVASQDLNFLSTHSSYRKPRAERVPVIVPRVIGDFRFSERRSKPPAAI
jgi:hypothetical protein